MGKQKALMDKLARTFQIRHMLLRQALAECLGTLILVMFGCGAVAQLVLSGGSHGMFLTVNFAFGFAATLGILVSGQISDALWDYGHGTLIVVGENATAGIFATYPSKHLTLVNGFFDQMIGTAALIVCILAIVDPYNNPIPRSLEAFTVGFVVLVIGLSMGFNSGYAVNPARDLGPRIFTALAGWGGEVFTANAYWFFVPIFAPFIGAVVGVIVYQLMVGYHVEGEAREKKQEEAKEEQEERLKLSILTTKDSA
ncbi:aquaporin-3-like isoform X3 [Coregonus clupeaformis]|uniref:aquaporin-3-like isoform X3 n=1 Tax=Coregonus clupeaformis TaxID=59861 RepID=UPI001BE04930|nr:aquaporin-3-like isoform X3 [Coregonus clupeaformis]